MKVTHFDYLERDALCTKTSPLRAVRIANFLLNLQKTPSIQFTGNRNFLSKFFFLFSLTLAKAVESVNLLHHGRLSVKFESSQKPPLLDKTGPALAPGYHMASTPRLPNADQRAQYNLSGCGSSPYPPKKAALSSYSPNILVQVVFQQSLMFYKKNVAPECVLSLQASITGLRLLRKPYPLWSKYFTVWLISVGQARLQHS